jgi:hypothetical protein
VEGKTMKLRLNPHKEPTRRPEEEPEEEGWGQYLGRNIGRELTTGLYEKARSGLGAADILETLNRAGEYTAGITPESRQQAEQFLEERGLPRPGKLGSEYTGGPGMENITKLFAPTSQATEEARQVLPKALTERREEDYYPTLAANLLFPYGVGKVAKAAGLTTQAPKLFSSLATSAGALAGSQGTKAAAQALGAPEEYADVLALGGGIAGGFIPHAAKAIFKGEHKKQAFYSEKKKLVQALDKEKKSFDDRIQSLEKSRREKYAKAKDLGREIKGDASKLKKELQEMQRSTEVGLEDVERNRIQKIIGQIDDLITGKEISIDKIKDAKRNLNATTYDRNLPKTLRDTNKRLIHLLDEVIEESGQKHPEHGKLFKEAETETQQLKDIQREQKEFNKNYATAKKDLESQTYEGFQKAQKTNINDALDFLRSQSKSLWWQGPMAAILKYMFGWKTGAGVFFGLNKALKEGSVIWKILKDNPELMKQAELAAENIAKRDFPAFTANMNRLKETLEPEEEKPVKRGLRFR